MTPDQSRAFAAAWIDAWNARDLDRILSHYADDVVFRSPRIALVTGDESCVVRGRAQLAAYWGKALAMNAGLRFDLDRVYVSKDAVTLAYRNHRGESASETMLFDGHGLVRESMAAFAV